MRLFLDSKIITYIALFEDYLCESTSADLDLAVDHWHYTARKHPDLRMLHEVGALRILWLMEEQAHFDWLFSEMAMDEILRIRSGARSKCHFYLLDRLIEHRNDLFFEEGRNIGQQDREEHLSRLFPHIPARMENVALQYCEAELVGADYFLTNDLEFIAWARASSGNVEASRIRELPFVARVLEQSTVGVA